MSIASPPGRDVVVAFVSPTCHSCRDVARALTRIPESRPDVSLVAVVSGERAPAITFAAEAGLVVPLLWDKDGSAARVCTVAVTPTTAIVGADGILRNWEVGGVQESLRVLGLGDGQTSAGPTTEPVPPAPGA